MEKAEENDNKRSKGPLEETKEAGGKRRCETGQVDEVHNVLLTSPIPGLEKAHGTIEQTSKNFDEGEEESQV